MKKSIIVLVFILAITGCGGGGNGNSSKSNNGKLSSKPIEKHLEVNEKLKGYIEVSKKDNYETKKQYSARIKKFIKEEGTIYYLFSLKDEYDAESQTITIYGDYDMFRSDSLDYDYTLELEVLNMRDFQYFYSKNTGRTVFYTTKMSPEEAKKLHGSFRIMIGGQLSFSDGLYGSRYSTILNATTKWINILASHIKIVSDGSRNYQYYSHSQEVIYADKNISNQPSSTEFSATDLIELKNRAKNHTVLITYDALQEDYENLHRYLLGYADSLQYSKSFTNSNDINCYKLGFTTIVDDSKLPTYSANNDGIVSLCGENRENTSGLNRKNYIFIYDTK